MYVQRASARAAVKGLRETVEWVYNYVPHYRRAFQDIGIEPEDIRSLDDLQTAFTNKQDFRDTYPLVYLLAKNEIVRFHSSSGTTENLQ